MVTVCEWFDLKTTQTVFAGFTSKPGMTVSGGLTSKPAATVSGGLASKPAVTVFSSLASKLVATVSWLSLKTKVVESFPVWTSKPTALIWCFGPQNYRDGFLVWGSKPCVLQFVGCTTKPTEGGRCGTRIKI
jgi:hypothetical protein